MRIHAVSKESKWRHVIYFQEVSGNISTALDFIDVDDLNMEARIFGVEKGSEEKTAHASKAVDAHTNHS